MKNDEEKAISFLEDAKDALVRYRLKLKEGNVKDALFWIDVAWMMLHAGAWFLRDRQFLFDQIGDICNDIRCMKRKTPSDFRTMVKVMRNDIDVIIESLK